MSTNLNSMICAAAVALSAASLVATPPAGADPGCGQGDQNVLWGDYCYVGAPQNQPPAPPSISWDQGLGTLTAHITDHSGAPSQCNYASALVDRSFPLPANGTFDVVIAPAVPAFKNWDVTVSCDNGTVAKTSKFF